MTVPALNTAVTGTNAAQVKVDIIANNVANINTIAFKKSDIETADLFYQTLKKEGTIQNAEASRRPVGVQVGYGTKVTGTNRNHSQGALNQTNQPLDIAITKAGYLAVTLPNGRIGYTRAGNLKKTANGLLATIDGSPLTNNITIDDDVDIETVVISSSGRMTAEDPQNPTGAPILDEQLELFRFPNERGLRAIGNNMYEATEASGEAIQVDDTTDSFEQRFLEGSNSTSVDELTGLITAQRELELNLRIIQAVSDMLKQANDIK